MIVGLFIATIPVMAAQGGAELCMLIIVLLLLTAEIAAIFLIAVMLAITAIPIPGIFLRLICFAFTTVFVLVEACTCTASGL